MIPKLTTTRILFWTTLLTLAPIPYAFAQDLPREKLLSLANNFVSRIGQKLQDQTKSDPNYFTNIPDDELLILQPRLSGKTIIEGSVSALRQKNAIFLSFHDLCQSLGFPLRVDPHRLTAQGWYIQEKYLFSMDLTQNKVLSRGDEFTVTPQEWFIRDGGLYINATSIRKWMKIDSEIVFDELIIDLAADEPFPLENKLQRRNRTIGNHEKPSKPVLPRLDQPYAMADMPQVNATVVSSYHKSPTQKSNTSQRMNVETTGDLLNMTTQTFTTLKDDKGLDSFRFTMERESETSDMLGPLQASHVKIGDLYPHGLDMAGSASYGLGAYITNNKNSDYAGNTSRRFEGDIPPDWDVELYNGDNLIEFQSVGVDGRYRFDNVDLYTGDNDFRLVFYGPQGQVREERINIPIDIDTVGDNQESYDISLSMAQTQTYTRSPSDDVDTRSPQIIATYQRGITDGLSLNTGIQIMQAEEEQKIFSSVGTAVRLGKTLLNLDVLNDEEMNMAWRIITRRRFGEHDVLSSTIFRTPHFNPDNIDDYKTEKIENRFTLRGPLGRLFDRSVTYNLNSEYDQTYQGDRTQRSTFGVNTQIGRFSVGESLTHHKSDLDHVKTNDITGTTTVRTSVGETHIRGNIDYKISPDPKWNKVLLNAERRIDDDKTLRAELTHDIDPNKTKLSVSSNWYHDKFTLTPLVSYDTNKELQATVSLGLSSIYDTKDQKIRLLPTNGSNKGIVRAFVYFDKDGNNQFNNGDETLPDVRVMTVQTFRSAVTDESGVAVISNIPEYTATDVTVDTSTLNDPYYILGNPGASIYARPGEITQIEFPVHLSGELDGRIVVENKNDSYTPPSMGGMRLQLINDRGDVTMTTVSAFDGYYVFSIVPPGKYIISINPDDLKTTTLRQPLPKFIQIGYDGKVLSGQNINLQHGAEIPVFVDKIDKNRDNENNNLIALNFGSYRSELLAQLIRVRMFDSFRKNDIDLNVNIRETMVQKNHGYELQTMMSQDITRAKEICDLVIQKNISCSLTIPPHMLFDQVSDNSSSQKPLLDPIPNATEKM